MDTEIEKAFGFPQGILVRAQRIANNNTLSHSQNQPRLRSEIEDALGTLARVQRVTGTRNTPTLPVPSSNDTNQNSRGAALELRRQQRRHELQQRSVHQFENDIRNLRQIENNPSESDEFTNTNTREKEAILFAYEVTETFDGTTEVCTSDCSICMEPILKDSLTYFKYECGHALHIDCVKQWMYTTNGRASCPNCRKEYSL